jgi:NADPH:quinone reductase-like Zn-dependent oxidoreductase
VKAVIQEQYGPPFEVLSLQEIDMPVIKKDDEVLVRVHTAAVHAGDWLLMSGRPPILRLMFGLRKPRKRIPGFDLSGYVEEVGSKVTELRPGDEVFGTCKGSCAEHVVTSAKRLAPKPANLPLKDAAAIAVSGITALRGMRDAAKLQPGQKVLITGASGGVGTFAVQIAKSLGAEVTGVCSTRNVDLVRSIGADHVIDYTRQDFTQGDERYDIILDNAGKHSLSEMRQAVSETGKLIPNSGTTGGKVFGPIGRMLHASLSAMFVRKQASPFVAGEKREDMLALKDLIEAGTITPVIDETYPLGDTAEAMAHIAAGHASGKTLIAVAAG